MRVDVRFLLFTCSAALLVSEVRPDWRSLRQQARTAREQKDYAKYRDLVAQLWPAMNGHAMVLFALAGADALAGDEAAAIRHLELFAEMGLAAPEGADPNLVRLQNDAKYVAVQQKMKRNAQTVGDGKLAFELPDAETVPEDIGYDARTRSFYFSSVRQRKVIRRSAAGEYSDFVMSGQDGLWGAYGLAIDSQRRILWVSTAATPEIAGIDAADAGKSAVLQYALDSGKLIRRYEAPKGDGKAVIGDIAIDAKGDLIGGDAYGMAYKARRNGGELETLVARGTLSSAQQPVPLTDGRHALIADYTLGIGLLDMEKKSVSWLPHPASVAVHGIDGLYRAGDRLLALQNGTNPIRVMEFVLDANHERIVSARVLEQKTPYLTEPTHGVVVESEFFYIANSGSSKLEAGGRIKSGAKLERARIQKLSLGRKAD